METRIDVATPGTALPVTRRPKEPTSSCGAVSDDLRATFVENLKAARAEAGLSQRELAAGAGVSEAYVVQIEAGRRNITFDVATRLAKALGKRPGEMLKPGFLPPPKKKG